jgi:hypothetical protein
MLLRPNSADFALALSMGPAFDQSENVRIHMDRRICGRDVAHCLQVALPTQRRVRLGKTNGTVSMAIKSTNDKADQGPALCWGE